MRPARVAALALLLTAPPALAEGPRPLRYDLTVDAAVTGAAAAAWLTTEALKSELAPAPCRWCSTNGFDAGVRDLLLVPWSEKARTASDVLAYVVLPAGVVANAFLSANAAGSAREGWVDLLVVVESVTLAADLNQLVKYTVGRQRPFVHYGNFASPGRPPDPDDNLSFYSGHTSMAFALVTAAGTVSSLRGYPSTPWVFGVGYGLATAVGYFRIAGDEHYLTDVLAGAVLGSAVGFAVPWLFHRVKDGETTSSGATVMPAVGGIAIAF